MAKQFSWIFLCVSMAFFLFITGLTGYRIEGTRRVNLATAQERAAGLAAQAGSLAAAAADETGGPATALASTGFRAGMRRAFDADPRLLLAAIRSDEDGILWMVARNKSYLRDPEQPTPQWRGVPSYQVSQGYETLITVPVEVGGTAVLDALYVVIGREDLFPVVRDDLYLFLAFLLACGILLLLATGLSDDREAAGRPAGSAAPQSSRPSVRSGVLPASGGRPLPSPATGLGWHLGSRLAAEIERAASMDQDLAFARVVLDIPSRGTAPAVAMLREMVPLADLLFESGPGAFSVILPDADLDHALRHMEALRSRLAEVGHPASIGVSARGPRLIEAGTLLEEAETAARKAAREGGDRVVGFRADPAKFRVAVAAVT